MIRRVIGCVVALLLVACGGSTKALPTIAPLPQVPIESNEQAPPIKVDNEVDVPGRILFVNQSNIWVASGDSTTSLTSSGKKVQPAWSHDGRRIAYVQREESFSDLWVMNADGSNKTQITNNEPNIPARSEEHVCSITWAFYPAWSYDDELLAYVSQAQSPQPCYAEGAEEYPLSLYLYGTRRIGDGSFAGASFQRFVFGNGLTDISHPSWSPPGDMLVYATADRARGNYVPLSLGYYNYETDAHGPLAGPAGTFDNALDPALSPDGTWLAFSKRDGDSSDIWVIAAPDAAGTINGAAKRLNAGDRVRMPTWSPDSQHLAFFSVKNNQVYLTIADVQPDPTGFPSLSDIRDVKSGMIDVDSGMSWVK